MSLGDYSAEFTTIKILTKLPSSYFLFCPNPFFRGFFQVRRFTAAERARVFQDFTNVRRGFFRLSRIQSRRFLKNLLPGSQKILLGKKSNKFSANQKKQSKVFFLGGKRKENFSWGKERREKLGEETKEKKTENVCRFAFVTFGSLFLLSSAFYWLLIIKSRMKSSLERWPVRPFTVFSFFFVFHVRFYEPIFSKARE